MTVHLCCANDHWWYEEHPRLLDIERSEDGVRFVFPYSLNATVTVRVRCPYCSGRAYLGITSTGARARIMLPREHLRSTFIERRRHGKETNGATSPDSAQSWRDE